MGNSKKPTEAHRKELLSKLESIIKILNDRVEGDSAIPTLHEKIHEPLHEPLLINDENASVESSVIPSEADTTAVDQPSIAEEVTTHNNASAKMENPFLPRHIRARLYNEGNSARSRGNATSENGDDADSSKDLHDSIIDNLIAFYLPKIEADLRRRLKALAEKESHK